MLRWIGDSENRIATKWIGHPHKFYCFYLNNTTIRALDTVQKISATCLLIYLTPYILLYAPCSIYTHRVSCRSWADTGRVEHSRCQGTGVAGCVDHTYTFDSTGTEYQLQLPLGYARTSGVVPPAWTARQPDNLRPSNVVIWFNMTTTLWHRGGWCETMVWNFNLI